MQRQCGNATLFRTRAPYEMTFPHHEWVMHEQRVAGRARMHLAGAETLHQAHVLLELDKAFIAGARGETGRADRIWKNHLFGPANDKDVQTVIGRVTRLEFQDGKRKKATRTYHGRGTTHSHSLDFLQNIKDIGLESKISAHVPDKERHPLLHGLVMDSQQDRTSSKIPIRKQKSTFDEKTQKVLLKHTPTDHDLNIRAYCPKTMEVTKCHEDIQQPDGNGAVLRYVATYSLKFSDSMEKEWLNEQASDYSVARRILFSYHPLEPEMWLTLAQERFPQVDYKGSLVEFFVPLPDTENKPKLLNNYENATWRRDDMPFIQFLRKSNQAGEIVRHIKEKHFQYAAKTVEQAMIDAEVPPKEAARQSADLIKSYKRQLKSDASLGTLAEFVESEWDVWLPEVEEFANSYKPQAEKLVAASMYSMLNDRYYGQWLVLHKSFRELEDLTNASAGVAARVPPHYRYFAMALQAAPEFWGNDDSIQSQMELEAHGQAMIKTILSKVRAQRSLVWSCLNGEVDLDSVVEAESSGEDREDGPAEQPKIKLTASQKKFRDAMKEPIQRALKAANATSDEEIEDLTVEAQNNNKMLFANGGPGSGKTFVLHAQIKRWEARSARVLLVVPTGQLAAEMKPQHPNIDVDTYHGGLFFHKDLSEALGVMTQYDLIILDEVSMLTAEQFERVVAMWTAADKLPCILLAGDFWQMPVVDKNARRCDESPLWRSNVRFVNFQEQVRCKDPELQETLSLLRTAPPSKRQLKQILRGHRAWTSHTPEAWDILCLLRNQPQTTIVTCTRKASGLVNELAIQVLFKDRHKTPLGEIPVDFDTNPDNYLADGSLKKGKLHPKMIQVYQGERLFLTKNLDKENGFVNGMSAIVHDYDPASQCLSVITKMGKMLAVHLYTEEIQDHGNVTSFPIRLGYATTIPKIQGATVPHITVWLDRPGCRAAAYVALSRVERAAHYLIAGKARPAHFVPAQ
ncbi:ATP-dependent DNA helicase PIF1 (DNA repair and recombination helicase PIF1) [Durusdinium trenchii]